MRKNNKKAKNTKRTNNNKHIINRETGEYIINLDESESNNENFLKPIINENNKNKKKMYPKKKEKALGNKHRLEENSQENIDEYKCKIKKQKKIDDYGFSSNKKTNNDDIKNSKNENKIKIDEIKPLRNVIDKNKIVFPYDFTERIIDSLTCEYCGGIYIRPYVINIKICEHIFCLGCIIKILNNKDVGQCIICHNQFFFHDIKFSEITDFYVNMFFPQIPKIIENEKYSLKSFIIETTPKDLTIRCELKPFLESVPNQNRLPKIPNNKFIFEIKSEKEDVVSIVKKEVIRRLRIKLKEEEIELRIQGIEISGFKSYELLKKLIPLCRQEIYYYNKK